LGNRAKGRRAGRQKVKCIMHNLKGLKIFNPFGNGWKRVEDFQPFWEWLEEG
jgi:hypothetical protein